MERYEIVKNIGSGNFGVAKLVKDKWSGELFAIKFIERGQKVINYLIFSVFQLGLCLSNCVCVYSNWVCVFL